MSRNPRRAYDKDGREIQPADRNEELGAASYCVALTVDGIPSWPTKTTRMRVGVPPLL
jgi:hypothetical protein